MTNATVATSAPTAERAVDAAAAALAEVRAADGGPRGKPAVIGRIVPCSSYDLAVHSADDVPVAADLWEKATADAVALYRQSLKSLHEIGTAPGTLNCFWADGPWAPRDSSSELLHFMTCCAAIHRLAQAHFASRPDDDGEAIILCELRLAPRKLTTLRREAALAGVRLIEGESPVAPVARSKSALGTRHSLLRRQGTAARSDAGRRQPGVRTRLRKALDAGLWLGELAARQLGDLYVAWHRKALKRRLQRPVVLAALNMRPGWLARPIDPKTPLCWRYRGVDRALKASRGIETVPFMRFLTRKPHLGVLATIKGCLQTRSLVRSGNGAIFLNLLLDPRQRLALPFQALRLQRELQRRVRDLEARTERPVCRYMISTGLQLGVRTIYTHLEIQRGAERLFGWASTPTVVVQTLALTKDFRIWTAIAQRRGHRVLWIADRICTPMRQSNAPLPGEGFPADDVSMPSAVVVCDQVSETTLHGLGLAPEKIYRVKRDFSADLLKSVARPAAGQAGQGEAGRTFTVLLVLQDYHDDMLRTLEVATAACAAVGDDVRLLIRPHPNYRLNQQTVEALQRGRWGHGNVTVMSPDSPLTSADGDVFVTGYSTAVVDPLLRGKPVVWLRGVIRNAVFGREFIEQTGFEAGDAADLADIIRKLRAGDPRCTVQLERFRANAARLLYVDEDDVTTLVDAIGSELQRLNAISEERCFEQVGI